MTYYIDGQTEPNPILKFRAGERVKVVLRNEDEGMAHDFTIRSWQVVIPTIEGKGSNSVTFTVPYLRGSHAYVCTPHPSSMRGVIEIE
jgi:plastocyanin